MKIHLKYEVNVEGQIHNQIEQKTHDPHCSHFLSVHSFEYKSGKVKNQSNLKAWDNKHGGTV